MNWPQLPRVKRKAQDAVLKVPTLNYYYPQTNVHLDNLEKKYVIAKVTVTREPQLDLVCCSDEMRDCVWNSSPE